VLEFYVLEFYVLEVGLILPSKMAY